MTGRRRIAALQDLLCLWESQWHDGRLVSLAFTTKGRGRRTRGEAVLRVEIYPEPLRARRRSPLHVRFVAVREAIVGLNYTEIADMADEPIVFARLNETSPGVDLSSHIAGGHVRIAADSVKIVGQGRALVAAGRAVRARRGDGRRAATKRR